MDENPIPRFGVSGFVELINHHHVAAERGGQVQVVQHGDDGQVEAADPPQEVQLVAEVEMVGRFVQIGRAHV